MNSKYSIYIVLIVAIVGLASIFILVLHNNLSIQKIDSSGQAITVSSSNIASNPGTVTSYTAYKIVNGQTTALTSFSIPTTASLGTYSINKDFTSSTLFPMSINSPIKALSINAQISLLKEPAIVRVILVDSSGNEYLIHEEYTPLVTTLNKPIQLSNICEETCNLNNIIPKSINIQVENAIITINSVNYLTADKSFTTQTASNIISSKQQLQQSQEISKINSINQNTKSWTAGETSVSLLTYTQKKQLFRNQDGTVPDFLPDLQGFEYYKSGIFTIQSATTVSVPASSSNYILPKSWDWRTVNGENWMTSIKDQGSAGNCYAFAAVGSFESFINLYYNTHLNLDLSEQLLVDCYVSADSKIPALSNDLPNSLLGTGSRIIYNGIADESCDPYAQREMAIGSCNYNYVCSDWQSRIWKATDYDSYFSTATTSPGHPRKSITLTSDDDVKKYLITNGPLEYGLKRWGHAMVLIGYVASSDGWQTTAVCGGGDAEFCTSYGCIARSSKCTPGQTVCSPNLNDGAVVENYVCGSSGYWQKTNYTGCIFDKDTSNAYWGNCVNDKCVDAYVPKINDTRCVPSDYNFYTPVLQTYNPSHSDTYWIFKNSWGTGWGENGYARIKTSIMADSLYIDSYVGPPIFSPPGSPSGKSVYAVNCADKDKDGYCYWGIGPKPLTCSSNCKPEEDCDDSNPKLGPFISATNLNCRALLPVRQMMALQ